MEQSAASSGRTGKFLCLAQFLTSAGMWKGGGSFHDVDASGDLFNGPRSMFCSHLSQIVFS